MCSTTKALFSNLSAKPKGNFRPAVLNVKYVFDMNSIPNQCLDNGEKSEKKMDIANRGNWFSNYGLNSLRAKFLRGNINMYLHFMSFLHTDMP